MIDSWQTQLTYINIFRRPNITNHQATQNHDDQPQNYLTVVQMDVIKKLKSLWGCTGNPGALLVRLISIAVVESGGVASNS